jgi:hypothetical protein
MYLPEDETCFLLYEAEAAEDTRPGNGPGDGQLEKEHA